jgi:HSP20 family molecular chaperone IbpA
VTARLPGVRLQDVRIALTRDTLTIDAAERHHVLAFACPVDDRRATMHFHDGILWIHLPKLPT